MFTVSARGAYGLSALMELALLYDQSYNPKALQIKDIAGKHNIPQHYLEQILLVLRKAGIVESYRGSQGGYALARSPAQIQIMEVLSLLEGKLEVLSDQRKDNSLSFFWNALEELIHGYLDQSLEALMRKLQAQQQQITYSI